MDFVIKVLWSDNGMDQKLINQLLALPGEELHLKKGDFLFREGDKAEYFYVVVKGRMSIKKFEASGHIFALRLVGPNNVIGEVPLYGRTLEHMCSTPLLGRIALFIVYAMMCWKGLLQKTIHWPLQ